MTPEAMYRGGREASERSDGVSAPPSPKPRLTICPYCGCRSRSLTACETCRGKFDPLSRQATQNAMGPWFIRDEVNPYRPGCSYETLARMVARGTVTAETVIRGPSSRQFWTLARWCPGVAHLLGVCHSCQRRVDPVATGCDACGASFRAPTDRQALGLGEVRLVPGRGEPSGAEFRAGEGAPPAPGVAGEARAGEGVGVDPRAVRLERELRAARRWRTVWGAACLLLVLAIAAVWVAGRLDLGNGAIGRWIGAGGSAEAPRRADARPGDDAPPIAVPRVPRVEESEPASAPGDSGAGPGEAVEDQRPGGGEASTPAAPGAGEGAGSVASETRLKALEALRRLR